jgi:hypothetical protein
VKRDDVNKRNRKGKERNSRRKKKRRNDSVKWRNRKRKNRKQRLRGNDKKKVLATALMISILGAYR